MCVVLDGIHVWFISPPKGCEESLHALHTLVRHFGAHLRHVATASCTYSERFVIRGMERHQAFRFNLSALHTFSQWNRASL